MFSLIRILRTTLSRYWRAWRVERRNPGIHVSHPVLWDYDHPSAIEVGREVCIGAFTELAAFGASDSSIRSGGLRIGARTRIGCGCNIRACGGTVEIGSDCIIAQQVSLVAANHRILAGAIYRELPWDDRRHGVRVGNNVWIGAGVVVLPGCRIGDDAVVAAGSVVTRDIPSGELWGNIPARLMRRLDRSLSSGT